MSWSVAEAEVVDRMETVMADASCMRVPLALVSTGDGIHTLETPAPVTLMPEDLVYSFSVRSSTHDGDSQSPESLGDQTACLPGPALTRLFTVAAWIWVLLVFLDLT
jgi:hypothetical protein